MNIQTLIIAAAASAFALTLGAIASIVSQLQLAL
jgi:hypothetical protein